MVIASLAWAQKAWFALMLPRAADREEILRMKFKRFLHAIMLVPCQVIKGGYRILLRLLAYTSRVPPALEPGPPRDASRPGQVAGSFPPSARCRDMPLQSSFIALIDLAGIPAQSTLPGRSCTTTAPAATKVPSPIVLPAVTTTCAASQHPRPTSTAAVCGVP